jgi:CBS domain-containing protein
MVAAELMTRHPITVGPGAALPEAARRMHEHRVKRLPVVDAEGRVLGIVSRRDLLKVFLRADEEIAEEVSVDVLARTLWIEPGTIRVGVRDGVVTLEGQVERKSLIPVLVGIVHGVEGVVGVDTHLSYEVDDSAPEIPAGWMLGAATPGR